MHRATVALGLVLSLLGVPHRPAQAQQAVAVPDEPAFRAESEATAPSNRIEEIVVTARKRAERLEETPVAVTALSEDTLRAAGITRLDEIQDLVPNLQIFGSDSNVEAQIIIRGVGTSSSDMAFDPGVGVFIDGVFLPRSVGGLLDVVDIEQIEILRGPQGTLFGKNTVGGALNITTTKPKDRLEAFVLVRPGSRNTLLTRAMLNAPIDIGPFQDRLFARAAFATIQNGGWVENVPRTQLWADRNTLAFLGSLRWLPHDDIIVDLSGSWSRDHGYGTGGQCVYIQKTGLQALYTGIGIDVKAACDRSEPYKNWSDTSQLSDVVSYGTWGTIDWALGEFAGVDLNAKSITSWREQSFRLRQDFDGTDLTIVQISNAGGGSPFDGKPGFQRQVQQEFQLSGVALNDRLDFIVGYFALWEEGQDNRVVLSGFETAIHFGKENITAIDNFTWALFGQTTYSVTDWLSLTGGLRYSEDRKGIEQSNIDPFNPDLPPQTEDPKSEWFTAWTPMGTVSILMPEEILEGTAFDSLLSYFTYARGFKGGGFNGVLNPSDINLTEFAPETLNSFEVGAKSILFDHQLTINVAVFLGLYDDIQVTQLLDLTEQGEVIPNIAQVTVNAARATTRGIEFEFIALPIEGFRITGSMGLLDARYNNFPDAPSQLTGQPISRAGETFPHTPHLQTHLSMQYSIPLSLAGPVWMNGWITPRFDWSYRSSFHFEAPEIWASHQPAYHLLHLRLSYDFLDDTAQFALWGQNVTGTKYLQWAMPATASAWGSAMRFWGEPATWGAELSHRF
ncbi:MAG: TonB-dependent receptor [Deltaproteobacteria bacterium]